MSKKKPAPQQPKTSKPLTGVQSAPSWLVQTRLHTWALSIFAILLYLNTCRNAYALDDAIVITDNMFTREGLKGWSGIFSKDTFYGFFKEEGKANLVSGGRYRPFTLAMFALEIQFFGQKPWVSHLINVLLFALTVAVLHRLLLRLLRPRFGEEQATFVALAASVLFAAHPIHTEVVANIKGRDEIMALLGGLGALYFIFRGKGVPAFFCFLIGVFSKENALAFIAVVPLTLFWFSKSSPEKWMIPTLVLVLAAGVFLAVRTAVLGGLGLGDPPLELMNNPFLRVENGQWVHFTAGERLATVVYTWGKYLQLLVFPHPLSHDYYPKQIYLIEWSNPGAILGLLAYLGLAVVAVLGLLRRSPLSYAVWWFGLTFAMVSNLLFPVGTTMSERLIYIPSAGFSLACGLLLWQLYVKRGFNRNLALGVLVAVTVFYSLKTIIRNPVWKDNLTLFTTDIQTAPNSAKLRNAAGGELVTQSVNEKNESRRTAMLLEAVGHLQEAIRIHPTYKNAYLLLGNALNYLKRYEESIASYQKALALDPGYQEAINNLGITYRDAGKYYGEVKKDLIKSIGYLEEAYKMRPDEYETVRLLGVAYGIGRNHAKALEYFGTGTRLQPDNADAWFNLGLAYHSSGDPVQGDAYIRKAVSIDPEIMKKRQQQDQQGQ